MIEMEPTFTLCPAFHRIAIEDLRFREGTKSTKKRKMTSRTTVNTVRLINRNGLIVKVAARETCDDGDSLDMGIPCNDQRPCQETLLLLISEFPQCQAIQLKRERVPTEQEENKTTF